MAAESQIVAPDGSVVAHVLTHDYRYYLVDNNSLEMITEIEAYCLDCQDFVASESIRTPEDFNRVMHWLKSLTGEDRDKAEFICGTVEAYTKAFEEEQAFFRDRKSPPRCLDCGSVNLLQACRGLGLEPTTIGHPDYDPPGLTVEGFAFVSTASFYRLFSLEGEELKMPTEEIVDTVNRASGNRVSGMRKNGKLFYGRSFE